MVGIVISILKFLSIILGGVFGVIGLLINFKDPEGKITSGGRKALVIIIVSGVVALSSEVLEMILRLHVSQAPRRA